MFPLLSVHRPGDDSHPADLDLVSALIYDDWRRLTSKLLCGPAMPRDSGDSHPTDDGQEHGAPPVITSASGLGTQRSGIISNLSDTEATGNKFETPPVSASSRETNSELRQLLSGTLKKSMATTAINLDAYNFKFQVGTPR